MNPSSNAFVKISSLNKSFGKIRAVHDLSLDIQKGEIFALLGSSGCGKSTLLRMLAGFETPDNGSIQLAGQEITPLAPYERPINMMFQSYALFPHLNVFDNIAFGLKRDGLSKEDIKKRVQQMLELVQLSAFANRKPHQLSGGQQQRVALVRSLAKQPQLMLLDEPLGALDKKLRERTQLELVNIIESVGVTCIMVTHDQEEAMTMASRIAIMHEGRIVQMGKPAEIYEAPNCRFVADFIGNVNLFDGNVIEDEADHVVVETPECKHYVGHGITGTLGMPVSVAIRPEKIQLSKTAPNNLAINSVAAVIKDMAYLGSYTVYHLQLKSGLQIRVNQLNTERFASSSFTWGDTVYACWNGDAMVVLTQ